MLISKVKKDQLLNDLKTAIWSSSSFPNIDPHNGIWYTSFSPDQLAQLREHNNQIKFAIECQLLNLVEKLVETIYTSDDMESDLGLRS